MFFLVPYNISPIQQAIQAGHASLEYAHRFRDVPLFVDFVENHKTWIILNGGTTRHGEDFETMGTLNQIEYRLITSGIHHSSFREPDLDYALTAVCFIADERVFNWKDYPSFDDYIRDREAGEFLDRLCKISPEELPNVFSYRYSEWLQLIGGKYNAILKEIIKDKRLA